MNDEKTKVDELVAELDNFFKNGGSHMNVESTDEISDIKITKKKYNECCDGENACGIPTEFFDEEDV